MKFHAGVEQSPFLIFSREAPLHGFEIKQFWAKEPVGAFAKIANEASLIKIENGKRI